jgi:hypothetical protein
MIDGMRHHRHQRSVELRYRHDAGQVMDCATCLTRDVQASDFVMIDG